MQILKNSGIYYLAILKNRENKTKINVIKKFCTCKNTNTFTINIDLNIKECFKL